MFVLKWLEGQARKNFSGVSNVLIGRLDEIGSSQVLHLKALRRNDVRRREVRRGAHLRSKCPQGSTFRARLSAVGRSNLSIEVRFPSRQRLHLISSLGLRSKICLAPTGD